MFVIMIIKLLVSLYSLLSHSISLRACKICVVFMETKPESNFRKLRKVLSPPQPFQFMCISCLIYPSMKWIQKIVLNYFLINFHQYTIRMVPQMITSTFQYKKDNLNVPSFIALHNWQIQVNKNGSIQPITRQSNSHWSQPTILIDPK